MIPETVKWVFEPRHPQVDLAFHPSGVDKIRTSLVLGNDWPGLATRTSEKLICHNSTKKKLETDRRLNARDMEGTIEGSASSRLNRIITVIVTMSLIPGRSICTNY